jgi:dipeptidase E
MENMKLLLISNSTNAGEEYLKYPIANIAEHLKGVTEVLFVPYAAVTFSYDEYERKVQERFNEIGIKVTSVHRALNKRNFVRHAQAIVIGGGNTFALLKKMQEEDLLDVIYRRVKAGMPYVGWSAGSNVTCPTICTTNDMPIVQPESFRAIGLVPFQINPHYLDANPEGHAGETREQRINEYIEANRSRYVVGLREGCMLRIDDNGIELIGSRPMRIFKKGQPTYEVNPGDDISFLLKR